MLHWTSTIGHSHFKVSCGCCIVWVVSCAGTGKHFILFPAGTFFSTHAPYVRKQRVLGTVYERPSSHIHPCFCFWVPTTHQFLPTAVDDGSLKWGNTGYTDRRSNKIINLDSSKLPGLLSFSPPLQSKTCQKIACQAQSTWQGSKNQRVRLYNLSETPSYPGTMLHCWRLPHWCSPT